MSLVSYEVPVPKVARITLNRPDRRNAQDTDLLYALNDAFDRAALDDSVVVIVLAANGPHFSAGHDLREPDPLGAHSRHQAVGTSGVLSGPGASAVMAREEEIYLGFSERWRNIPKPTIAEVNGKVISGGLMLAWPCDLIVAADDAEFIDNVVAMGVNAVEFFNHPYEFGVRKAKELPNGTEFYAAVFALWKAGAIPQLMSPVLPARERDAIIALAAPSLVIGAVPAAPGTPVLPAGH